MINKVLFSVFILVVSGPTFGSEVQDSPSFLIQSAQELPTAQADETIINYNSKQFDGHELDGYSKAELIQMIRSNSIPAVEKKVSNFFVPFGPSVDWTVENIDLEGVDAAKSKSIAHDFKKYRIEFSKEMVKEINENIEALSESELRSFLSKKHGFLLMFGDRFEQIFKVAQIKPPYKLIQGLLNSLNNIFFQKSRQFVGSNTYGVPVFITSGVGATMGRLIYDFLIAKTPLKDHVNPNFGFYLGASLGLGVSRIQVDKKSAWVLDLFFDFETLKRAFLPIFEAGAGGGFGFSMETRSLPEKNQKITFSKASYKTALYAPVIGTTRSGPTDLSTQHSMSAVFPLGSTFYETYSSRRYIHIVLKTSEEGVEKNKPSVRDFFESIGQFFKRGKTSQISCMKYYSRN